MTALTLQKLKPRRSAKRRYDHDKYPREEIAEIFTHPYKVISAMFDHPYEEICDDVEYEMEAGQSDRNYGITGQFITRRRPRY